MLSTARLVFLMLALLALAPFAPAKPPVFKDMPFDQALAESKKTGKILVLDAMASWCGPCKIMDKKTWSDPEVVKWLDAHAIALQVDMDEQPDVRKRLEIHAYPTIVAFRDGGEFDRIVGLRLPGPFLEWLRGVEEGKSALAQTQATLKRIRDKAAADPAAKVDCHLRMETTGELVRFGQMEDAGVELEWLWRNMPSKCQGVKGDRRGLSEMMSTVARRHEAARWAFTTLRDESAASLKATPGSETLRDWITLCGVIGDWDSVAAWAGTMTKSAENIATLRTVEKNIFGVLIDKGQWATAGFALASPVEELEQRGAQLGYYDHSDFGASEDDDAPAKPVAKPDESKPKTVPAIPLSPGGMKPGTKTGQPAAASSSEKPAEKPKTVPAIPLSPGGMKPAKPAETPPAKEPGDQPKTVPMIPLTGGGMKAATAPKAASPSKDPQAVAAEVRRRLTGEFRKQAAEYYAACLAAGRNDDAQRIVGVVMKYADDPMSRLRLVAAALQAGQTRAEFSDWLAEAHDAILDSETFDFCTGKPKAVKGD